MLVETHEVEVQILYPVFVQNVVGLQQATEIEVVDLASFCEGKFIKAAVSELLADVEGFLMISQWVSAS